MSIFHSPLQAVQCAIDIQLALQKELYVPLRVGIHSGEVAWDKEGIYGNAVNIASRLESFAEIGSILVSSKVKEELNNQPTFRFQSLGLFELKNASMPMEIFAVANEGIVLPKPTLLEGKGQRLEGKVNPYATRIENFVGREKELGILHRVWKETGMGNGLMIGISGEPGIGKTTLIEDFLIEISKDHDSHAIARGNCSERLAGTEAYLPFLEILEELIQLDQYAQLLKQLAPAWYVQLRPYSIEESRTLEMATQATQERRKREIANFFVEVAKQKPLLLFIDDLHWADESSTDLLAYLAPRSNSTSWLLLTTYRPADMKMVKHPFLKLKKSLHAKRLFKEVPLPFLEKKTL